ncbi:MAG: hypothetical protein NVSMB1_20000 [Polyangiales bacterium]
MINQSEDPAAGKSVVLVVEDDLVIRESLCEVLNDEGYAAVGVGTLSEAFAAIARIKPSLLVADLMLHDETAEPLLQRLSESVDAPATILMSAAGEAVRVADMFGIPLLRKPFDIDAALALLKRVDEAKIRPVRAKSI